jgi:hypothetical protein
VLFLWLPTWCVFFFFPCMFSHCDSSYHNLCNTCLSLLYYFVFISAACLVLCGIKSALLIFVIVMASSHNIVTFLCHCNVDRFILEVVVLKYDCKPTLNTTVKKIVYD